ncbi:hypothetical protein [Marivita sp. XM-24bin2]|uniref:hypothetical protein n=1 Tax=Marivita sp. XM-24bin2 TaxID=2133951 RepID=UPI000D7B4DE1|nr:hypothetical protein [Marivita sp. XM-24bin2]MCR9110430.1 hypothetical protein [Paracoccaceae bacterium]PWL36867.1 MAG: hypothetical protein DCO97_02025 [Marivita sp. XM-24bin2]
MNAALWIIGLGAVLSTAASTGYASDDASALRFEADLEIGLETVYASDDPDEEYNEAYVSGEASIEYAFSEDILAFAQMSIESVTDAEGTRAFQDLGAYISEIGLFFDFEPVHLTLGKFSPSFGVANDALPGFFGADFVDEYEVEEVLGLSIEAELGVGTFGAAVFYADDTRLSESWGRKRGRNMVSDGGVGNTGKLNNFTLTYDLEIEETTLHAGFRHLSEGEGDEEAERGAVLGFAHEVSDAIEIVGEVAHFSHFEGSSEDAIFGALGLSYGTDFATYSASVTRREIEGLGTDTLFSAGFDKELSDHSSFTAGYAFTEEEGVESHRLAVAFVFEFGG